MTLRSTLVAALAAAMVVTACGSDTTSNSGDDAFTGGLTGIVRTPAPAVDGTELPSLSDPGETVAFRAEPDGLQVVYFGFTSCPDVCPTTLADFTVALRQLGPGLAERVELVMVTVDPDRDLELLDAYVNAFVEGSTAAGTDDDDLLSAAAEPFGASWEVRVLDDGTVEVDHTPFLYVVDDQGELVLTWQFGASSVDMAADMEALLERSDGAKGSDDGSSV